MITNGLDKALQRGIIYTEYSYIRAHFFLSDRNGPCLSIASSMIYESIQAKHEVSVADKIAVIASSLLDPLIYKL